MTNGLKITHTIRHAARCIQAFQIIYFIFELGLTSGVKTIVTMTCFGMGTVDKAPNSDVQAALVASQTIA